MRVHGCGDTYSLLESNSSSNLYSCVMYRQTQEELVIYNGPSYLNELSHCYNNNYRKSLLSVSSK